MTPFLNNSILIAISKHGGGGHVVDPSCFRYLYFDYTARGILSSFTLMGKTIWWYLHLPIWVCSPVKGRDMCYASKLSVRWSQAGIIYSSWDWDVTRYYCCCSTEMSEDVTEDLTMRPWLKYKPPSTVARGFLCSILCLHISNQHTNLFESNTKYNEYQPCNLMASVLYKIFIIL